MFPAEKNETNDSNHSIVGSVPMKIPTYQTNNNNNNNSINKSMVTKPISINSYSRSHSINNNTFIHLNNSFGSNSFQSKGNNNNITTSNNTNILFSGSLPFGSLKSNFGSYQEDEAPTAAEEDIRKTGQYVEDIGTNTTTTPTQYFKDKQQNLDYNGGWGKDDQVNLDYIVNHVTTNTSSPAIPLSPPIKEQQQQQQPTINGKEHMEHPLLNIAEYPTEELLKMLTALLEKIVNSNDELNISNHSSTMDDDNGYENKDEEEEENSISCFSGKHIPQISIEQYLLRIQKYCPTTNDIFLSLLVYFDRISKKWNNSNSTNENEDEKQNFVMDSYNIHRLLISAVTVSTKFFSDFFYSNARYARVGGIPLQEMNKLELQFMVLCDFKLLIPIEELQRYADLLYNFWNTNNNEEIMT